MNPSNTEGPSVWLMLAVVGDPESETVTWSVRANETSDPATITVTSTWASDIATATQEYLGQIMSIYANYVLFQGLADDRIQEGVVGISDPVEQDREPSG